MKKIITFLLCLLLSGCAVLAYTDPITLDDVFAKDQEYIKLRRNEYSTYYEYYLPSDMSLFDSESLNTTMSYNDSRIVANINISGILNNRYYSDPLLQNEGYFDEQRLIYQKQGQLINTDHKELDYSVYIYDYDNEYLIYMMTKQFTIYGYCKEKELIPLCSRLLLFMKSASVNESYIIEDFSSRYIIELEKKQVNLFETIKPVNGVVNDMMTDDYTPEPD